MQLIEIRIERPVMITRFADRSNGGQERVLGQLASRGRLIHCGFTKGKITILQVPVIQKGGSRHINLELLSKHITDNKNIGAIGIEALVSLRRINYEPRYLYGVTEAAIEAAQCGLPFIIVCTEDATYGVFKTLKDNGLNYEIIDLRLQKNPA